MAISLDLRAPAARGTPTPPAPARPEPRPDHSRPDHVQLRARRNPRLVAIGVLCACVGGLGGAMAYQQAGQSHAVIVVQRRSERERVAAETACQSLAQLSRKAVDPVNRTVVTFAGDNFLIIDNVGNKCPYHQVK